MPGTIPTAGRPLRSPLKPISHGISLVAPAAAAEGHGDGDAPTPLKQVSLKVVPDARNETQHPKGSMLLSPLEVDESNELQDVCRVHGVFPSFVNPADEKRFTLAMLQPWRLNSIRGFALLTCVGEILAPESLTKQLPVAFHIPAFALYITAGIFLCLCRPVFLLAWRLTVQISAQICQTEAGPSLVFQAK